MLTPKYWDHNLCSWLLCFQALWRMFSGCSPLMRRSFWFWSETMGPCYCHISMQEFRFITFENGQTLRRIITTLLFLTVSKRGIHFEQSFLMDKCSCNIKLIRYFGIFPMPANSCNFTSGSFQTILRIFFNVLMCCASFERPMRSTPSVFLRPRLKPA